MPRKISIILGSLVGAALIQFSYAACQNMASLATPDADAQDNSLTMRVAALEEKVVALQARPALGKYCGATTVATNGAIGTTANKDGYKKALQACAQVPGCGVAARMCSTTEITYSAQLGVAPVTGTFWVTSGMSIQTTPPSVDCSGWQNANAGFAAAAWSGETQSPVVSTCDVANRIVCCN